MEPRTLVAVVFGGADRLTDRSLESVARLSGPGVDVLVLDDRPDDGNGAADGAGDGGGGGRDVCDRLGLAYYRSPRPLGPARTANLAFLRALSDGYEAVLCCPPNLTVPAGVVGALAGVAATVERVASVAAWARPQLSQDVVDWIATALSTSPEPAVDVATAAGPCVLYPVDALREVGLFDPMYGSGDDHLADWSQRARDLGYRCMAAPGVCTSGVVPGTREAGPLVRFRHPSYTAAAASPAVDEAEGKAARAIVVAAARRFGYTLEVGWPNGSPAADEVRVLVEPEGARPAVTGSYCGFSAPLSIDGDDVPSAIATLLGGEPREVIVSERGRYATQVGRMATAPFMYPKRV